MRYWSPTTRCLFAARIFAGLLLASGDAGSAAAADRFVAPSGSDTSNNCLTATHPCARVSYATTQATSGDTINVASGEIRDNVRIDSSTSLTFLGGWDATFAQRDALGTPSVLKGGHVTGALGGHDRVWGIFADAGATITVTIDGFVLEKGRAGTTVAPDISNLLGEGRAAGGLAAIASDNGSITLRINNSSIIQNLDWYGGAGVGVWAFGNASVDAVLDGVRILRNRSKGTTGGLLAFSPAYGEGSGTVSLLLENCVIAGNQGNDVGGGISASDNGPAGSSVTVNIVSSTITLNTSRSPRTLTPGSVPPDARGGGGINAYSGGSPVALSLTDSILWGNLLRGMSTGADFLEPLGSANGQVTVDATHSDLGQVALHGGTFNDLGGNVAVDPMLDATYELLPNSPLIDAGTCTGAPPTDLEGDPRPSGSTCDIGADEFQF